MPVYWKWVIRSVPGFAWGLLMWASQVTPEQATSNIGAWLTYAGFDHVPLWLSRRSADTWGFWIGFVGFCIWIIIVYRSSRPALIAAPAEWHTHLPWGIIWDFEGFLGGNRRDGVTYVSCFQIKGMNRVKRPIQLKSARIFSCITSQQIPIHIRTESGYANPSEVNEIPGKARFRLQGLFYDPNNIVPGGREGIREDEFLRDFSEFIFEAEYDGRRFKKTFNAANINAELNRLKPERPSTPRITKKMTAGPIPETPLSKKRDFVDEGKIKLIDRAFKHLQSQCLPLYDRFTDQTIGPWRYKLLEMSPRQYSEMVWVNIQQSSVKVNEVIQILNENRLYGDVYNQLIGIGDELNNVIEKFRAFDEKIKLLPDKPTADNLQLVEAQGLEMSKAVGRYGQWLRVKSDFLANIRTEEMQIHL